MKLSRNDKTVLVAGLVIIVLFSGLFYYDLTRRRGAGSEEVVGTITFKRQQAQRKYASQVVWEDVAEAVPVHNHDSIRTAELSEAV
nr:iron dicitrate transport regulator FecR [Spirochaetota bacterium]